MSGSLLRERHVSVNPSMVKTFGAVKALVIQDTYFTEQSDEAGGPYGECDLGAYDQGMRIGLTRDQVTRARKALVDDGVLVEVPKPERTERQRKSYSVNVELVEKLCAPARITLQNHFKGYVRKRTLVMCDSAHKRPNIPINKNKEDKEGGSADGDPATTDEPTTPIEERAADHYLDRWSATTGQPRKRTSKAAINAMRLLHERGPSDLAEPTPIPWEEIRATVDWFLTPGNVRPWLLNNTQSPTSLRERWTEITLERLAGRGKPSLTPEFWAVVDALDDSTTPPHQTHTTTPKELTE